MSRLNSQSVLTRLEVNQQPTADDVVYGSKGCVLVIGDDASVGPIAQRVGGKLPIVVFATGIDRQDWGAQITGIGRSVTHLSGHLGAFCAESRVGDDITDLGAASANPSRLFDLVLDLSAQPLITAEVLPLGYFAPSRDDPNIETALSAIREMVGRFSKPRFFRLEPWLCAHSSSGITGCTRCIEVCSANAITSEAGAIRVDPHLCQGCASCSLACPTGAISFRSADRPSLVQAMQRVLGEASTDKTLIVHEDSLDEPSLGAAKALGAASLQVTALPAVGDELWLRALAMGAHLLVLVVPEHTPPKTRELMKQKVLQVKWVLEAMGQKPDRLVCIGAAELFEWLGEQLANATGSNLGAHAKSSPTPLPSWEKFKRLAWVDGMRQLGVLSTEQSAGLPDGAPMGAVHADASRCSLCFACTHVCPTRALVAVNQSTQKLLFQESACVQCGLCVKACPENALNLVPRMAPTLFSKMVSVVLHQDDQIKCTACGTPFISRRQLASSLERLKDHPIMFDGGREALMTCPACRQQKMLES